GWNAAYLEAEYERFKADPRSVPEDVRAFFQGFDLGLSRAPAGAVPADDAVRLQSAVADLIQAYRELGHLAAKLDPFGRPRPRPAPRNLERQGPGPADLDRIGHTGSGKLPDHAPLRDVVAALEQTYCGPIGAEIMHVQDVEERRWLLDRFEELRGRIALT